jgi:hypothetical protein
MATQDSRIKIKRSTVTATVPTVPSSNDHTDGTWVATDIYKGELFFNQADDTLWTRGDSGVICLGGSASLTIASADVLTLNTTPLTIVGAVAGYAIEVVSASVKIDNPGAPYATNVGLELICNGATVKQAVNLFALNSSVTSVRRFSIGGSTGATDTQVIANADLLVQVPTGDPTGGDADITVFVNYRLIPA